MSGSEFSELSVKLSSSTSEIESSALSSSISSSDSTLSESLTSSDSENCEVSLSLVSRIISYFFSFYKSSVFIISKSSPV